VASRSTPLVEGFGGPSAAPATCVPRRSQDSPSERASSVRAALITACCLSVTVLAIESSSEDFVRDAEDVPSAGTRR